MGCACRKLPTESEARRVIRIASALTFYRDDRFELRFDLGSVTPAAAFTVPSSGGGPVTVCEDVCSSGFGSHLAAGYPFELGLTAATGGSNAIVSVVTTTGFGPLGGPMPLRIERQNVCF